MSSCISGGGRAYRLNIEIIKSPSTSWASNSSSPSSTLYESSNSPQCAISTRKPRTPRKRPNQKYDEAAAILSTAYPKIFSTRHLTNPSKFTNPHDKKSKNPILLEPSDLLTPLRIIDNSCFLLHPPIQERPHSPVELKCESVFEKPCQSPREINSQSNPFEDNQEEDFDAESILDEETGEGIDSIMGNLSMNGELIDESTTSNTMQTNTFCYGYPVGLGFSFEFGMRRELKAMRNVDEGGDWWRFPAVNMVDLTPKVAKSPVEKKKKKVKKMVSIKNLESVKKNPIPMGDVSSDAGAEEGPMPQTNRGLLLKLNYEDVLNEWSDKGSPFSGDSPPAESDRTDVQARLAQIDLFGGERDAIVLRYKEKRRTRLFSKKIRYQVRKVNADRRPRMKGRFVRGVDP
ncbi:protein CHLOROPLAST IMPORT APPARATUS 2-like [Dorcoceras hygrometricum]|uniref:Protein CHLOROPLAST IMPORT APPARATUS 2-like n=1 Tax=Dorcoceras hygrometricum TaxID=472368 RepID=A0A2Z7CQF3_9LAMI|nr:protein CHLOROPLAST IMPORT APPARATUS 2-like [Dorcoceras hygrometricum]